MIKLWNYTRGTSARVAGGVIAPACWIQATAPDERDSRWLTDTVGVPESILTDIADADERARYDTERGWQVVILRVPCRRDGAATPFVTVPLGILIKTDCIVTVCHEPTEMMDDFVSYHRRRSTGFTDPTDLTLRLFLSAAVWFNKYLRQVNTLIEQAKFNLEGKKIANRDLISLSHMQDSLTYFATAIRGDESLLAKVKNRVHVTGYREQDADAKPCALRPAPCTLDELIDDVDTEMSQARETNWIYINILNSIMETNANIINNDMNSVMKLLTALNIVIMIPSLIAGLLGMNLLNGMEESPWGFPLALLLCGVSIAVSMWWFRRKSWI